MPKHVSKQSVDSLTHVNEQIIPTNSNDIVLIKAISGLTWNELADAFDTTVKTLHAWRNGIYFGCDKIRDVELFKARLTVVAESSRMATASKLRKVNDSGNPLYKTLLTMSESELPKSAYNKQYALLETDGSRFEANKGPAINWYDDEPLSDVKIGDNYPSTIPKINRAVKQQTE